jgi:hypothetical protein
MFALIFLGGSILLGIEIARRFFPFTNRAERLLWGAALGPMMTTWAAYLAARAIGELTYPTLSILTVIIWGLVSLASYRSPPRLQWSILTRRGLGQIKLEIALAIIFATIFGSFFYRGMFHPTANGMFLTATSSYDLPYHLALATSFLYGQNFPPMNPVLPTVPLRYHFLPDFYAAILMKLGLGIWPAFAVTSTIAALALVGIFYCFARRLTESKRASFIATLLFFFSGGLGFLLFFSDWRASAEPFFTFFWNMKENYTDIWSRGIKWTNLITSGLIPQRAMLHGMPVAFLVLSALAVVWKKWTDQRPATQWQSAELLLPAGVVTGLLPLFHFHAYMVILFVSCGLMLIRPRLSWLAFFAPAILIGLPQWRDFGTQAAAASLPLRFHLGWMSYIYSNFYLFLLRNFGLPLVLIVPAFFVAPRHLRTFYLPFAALMVLCFVILVSKDDVDNTKLMFYWHGATAVVLGAALAKWMRGRWSILAVALVVLACTLSGFLSLVRESRLVGRSFSPAEIAAAEFARTLPPRSKFLTGPVYSQPALCLAGKPIVLGFEFLITSQGYPVSKYRVVLSDVKRIYRGDPQAAVLLARYGVKYIYLSSYERKVLNADSSYFDQQHRVVFKNSEVAIYAAAPLESEQ